MSKHTPGPWGIYDTAAYGIHICKGGIAGQHIGSAQAYVGLTHDEARANARLRAAAPDLLEALRLALAAMENLRAYLIKHADALPPCSTSTLETRISAARATIAKAEGGA